MGEDFAADTPCGAAAARRTAWGGDSWCERRAGVVAGNISLLYALAGAVLDVAMMPHEDDLLYAQPIDGSPAYYYGFVGEALSYLALDGQFEIHLHLVKAPESGGGYDGDWNAYAADWVTLQRK
jgi:hypothetical protein